MVDFKDMDNTDLAIQCAKALHRIDKLSEDIDSMTAEIGDMCDKAKYDTLREQQEGEIRCLLQLIADAQTEGAELQAQIEASEEADRAEDELVAMRAETRRELEATAELEARHKEMLERWRYNERVYTTVSHNFKFEFLPRLERERAAHEDRMEDHRLTQKDIAARTTQVTAELGGVEHVNKEFRLKVEELSFHQRTLNVSYITKIRVVSDRIEQNIYFLVQTKYTKIQYK